MFTPFLVNTRERPPGPATHLPKSLIQSMGNPMRHNRPSFRVAVVRWSNIDEIADAIYSELVHLGHTPEFLWHDAAIPGNAEVVFSFAPYGSFLAIASQLEALPKANRPILIHWNTEGIPDLRLPWTFVQGVGQVRSWLGRVSDRLQAQPGRQLTKTFLIWQKTRMLRYRYVGDYYYAYQKGWLDLFADSSAVYAQIHQRHGLPALHVPWGRVPEWHCDLGAERDIDVFWMGTRGTKRRSTILDQVRERLRAEGVEIYMADNEEHEFVFGQDRTRMLNRAKITLNVARTWYDDNYSRFTIAAPNRSLVVSETLLPHCPTCEAGVHYVSAHVDQLAETILYYLEHEAERNQIVENAYNFVSETLTMRISIGKVMDAVEQIYLQRNPMKVTRGAVE